MPDDTPPLSAAVTQFQAGDLAGAEKLCRQVLAADANNAEALHLVGVIAHRGGRNDIGVDFVRRAIAADETVASFQNTLGYLLRIGGHYSEAIAALRRAVALQADYADAHNNLGIAYAESGDLDAAETAYRDALAHRAEFPEAQNNLGNLLYRMGRIDDSLAAYEAATTLRPDYAEAHANRGDACLNQGKTDEALDAYRKAAEAAPKWPSAWFKLGSVLFQKNDFERALRAFRRSIDLNPNHLRGLTNLGATLEKLGRYEEAALILRHALVLAPDDLSSLKNLGHVILKLGHVGEGLHLLRRAIEVAPDDPDAHYTLGNALLRMERLQEAVASYARVRELQPSAARAYFAPASVLLMNGQYKDGWAAYESRFDMAAYKPNVKNVRERLWDGSPLNGRRLLVHVEQGFGDTLEFVRYVPLIRERFGDGKIFLLCEPELARILRTLDGVDEFFELRSDASVTYDLHVPLLSLPHRFGTTLETIPNKTPYLKVPAGTKAKIRRRKETKLAVAFVWAGRPTHSDDRFRSCTVNWFATLFDIPGVDFYSIQWGPRAAELTPHLERKNVSSMTDKLTDFAETAAIIDQADLVISIDTAVAHLAGALGKPVWTILPFGGEWRWLFRREDTPWYPNMRLFRQPILGDWRPVFQRMGTALSQMVGVGEGNGQSGVSAAVGQHDTAPEPGASSAPKKKSGKTKKAPAKPRTRAKRKPRSRAPAKKP
ncbi:MAG: tetratricopeptide repeat protein [Alphaproteobacteria bacterium]|nr:tetratricopeptide repeat protein [Alphaproteobacteria bacterium]